jgi:hypothetical protein
METQPVRDRCLYLLHLLACQVGYINDRVICGDINLAAARRQAQALADETAQDMQAAGAGEAWIAAHQAAGGAVGISWQVLLRNDPHPLHGNITPKGRA